MMMLPDGWVTGDDIGLARYSQLRLLGNGVVPLQAEAAVRMLLSDWSLGLAPEAASA